MAKVIGRRLKDFLPKSSASSKIKRARLAKRLRGARARDFLSRDYHAPSRGKWSISRSLDSLGATGDFMKRRITAVRARLGPNRKIRVLDLGAGEGFVSQQLCSGIPKSKLELHVLGVTRSPRSASRSRYIDGLVVEEKTSPTKILVGSLENYRFARKYDFVFSATGALVYGANVPIAVEKICNSLNKGGEAVLHVAPKKFLHLIPYLRKAGFSVRQIRDINEADWVFHIVNRRGLEVSLDKQIKSALRRKIKTRLFVDLKKN